MSSREQILNVIFIFIATAALGAMLGLSVLRTVDTRLSDVSINIPEIKVPPAKVEVQWPLTNPTSNFQKGLDKNYRIDGSNARYSDPDILDLTGGALPTPRTVRKRDPVPDISSDSSSAIMKNMDHAIKRANGKIRSDRQNRQNKNRQIDEYKPGVSLPPGEKLMSDMPISDRSQTPEDIRKVLEGPDFKRNIEAINDSNYYLAAQQLESAKVSGYEPIPPWESHRDIDHYQANRAYLGTVKRRAKGCEPHQFIRGEYLDRPCEEVQYYKNPNEMTERQILKFKKYAKFDKMTPRDYMNWLSLYANEEDILTPHNQEMLRRFKRRIPLTWQDIPRDEWIPKSAKQYYNKLSNEYYYDSSNSSSD